MLVVPSLVVSHLEIEMMPMGRVDKKKLRELSFSQLEDAVQEAERLLDGGYRRYGQWSLGQICRHCREVQEMSLRGFPRWMLMFAWLRPVMRKTLLPRIMRGESPIGLPTAPWLVPRPDLDDREEVLAFVESAQRLRDHLGDYFPHPGFGQLGREGLLKLYTAHAAHHLRFLQPLDPRSHGS
jgi:hypothetical protein